METAGNEKLSNFIKDIITQDVADNKNGGKVVTRFPPEPNGYLHIGHAKAFCLSFLLAEEFNGLCHLRFDDTNPEKEDMEFVKSIQEDIKWLGFSWGDKLFYSSDYFHTIYEYAVQLIKDGKAYVDNLNADEMREYRGTLKEPGKESPYKNRSVKENLELFEKMKNGDFAEGECILRAKIDMASSNMNLRDPAMYRILKVEHHQTGNEWCIYPTYDFVHGQSDSLEGITHSLCDLSFENHRPLYDWFIEQLGIHHPQQIEFARLNMTYTVLSKRYLAQLVSEGHVCGWDDPRMPTLSGLRRRGVPSVSVRNFIEKIGLAKRESLVDLALLEHCVRDELNKCAPRYMAVLDPIKVIVTNYPEGKSEKLTAVNNPERPEDGTREVPFGKELYIESGDFMEDAPKKYFRLTVGREVRLRYAYFLKCNEVVKNADGSIKELLCTYDPETRGGNSPDGRKVKATIHWVAAETAVNAEVRSFNTLFTKENPADINSDNLAEFLNPESKLIQSNCKLEPALKDVDQTVNLQFERIGYFIKDSKDSTPDNIVFNRTVTLKDQWARMKK